MKRAIVPLLIIFFPLNLFLPGCWAWTTNILRKKKLGGEHLIRAGKALQAASECININYYAYPSLLREAGTALKEAGEAWDDNWEAATYALSDCSEQFYALSQLQKLPVMQKAYKGVSGELASVASFQSPSVSYSAPSLANLSVYLNEAAISSKESKDCKDSNNFCKSLKEASQSIGRLANEQKT